MKTVRLMFVGAGRVSQHYTKILKKGQVDNFKIVSVVDTKHSAATSFRTIGNTVRPSQTSMKQLDSLTQTLQLFVHPREIIIRLQNIVFCPIFMY